MDVPITQFRKSLFKLVNRALEGEEVWVSHRGNRLRLVPECKTPKLSRITPMQIIVDGPDVEDKTWQMEIMREWERKWERRLGPIAKPAKTASVSVRAKTVKARRAK